MPVQSPIEAGAPQQVLPAEASGTEILLPAGKAAHLQSVKLSLHALGHHVTSHLRLPEAVKGLYAGWACAHPSVTCASRGRLRSVSLCRFGELL